MKNYYIFIIVGCFMLAAEPRALADKPANVPSGNLPDKPESNDKDKAHGDDHDGSPGEHPNGNPEQDPKAIAFKEAIAKENSNPQDFYGKVVDQYGLPVVGANVTGYLHFIVGMDADKTEQYTTTADNQGQFGFTKLSGEHFGAMPSKQGYVFKAGTDTYRLPANSERTTPNKRAIYTMWKLKGAEPMTHSEGRYSLACDGVATNFDLLTGKTTSSGGDLTVSLVRNPLNINRRHPFDWTLTLQIAGGGLILIPTDFAYMNEAPTDGYQSTITVSMSASDPKWSYSYLRTYYFKARNGQVYGRVTVNLTANYQPPPTRFRLEIYANPNSSRNLEFDATKQVKY